MKREFVGTSAEVAGRRHKGEALLPGLLKRWGTLARIDHSLVKEGVGFGESVYECLHDFGDWEGYIDGRGQQIWELWLGKMLANDRGKTGMVRLICCAHSSLDGGMAPLS